MLKAMLYSLNPTTELPASLSIQRVGRHARGMPCLTGAHRCSSVAICLAPGLGDPHQDGGLQGKRQCTGGCGQGILCALGVGLFIVHMDIPHLLR